MRLSDVQQNPEVGASAPLPPTITFRLWERLDEAARRTVLGVLDQAVVSGTRFLTTAMVGRLCGPHQLGNYSLAFSLFALAAFTLEAAVSAPFTIYGHRLPGDERRRFAGSSLAHFGILAIGYAALFAVVAVILARGGVRPELAPVIGMLCVMLPVACLVDFARRYLISHLQLSRALLIDSTMMALQLGSLAVLASGGWLSAVTAYGCVTFAAACTGFTWLFRSRGQFIVERARILADAAHNWKFSRWLMAAQVAFLARNAAALWLLAAFLDASATGTYAACETVILMANPIVLAFNNVLTPQAARTLHNEGKVELQRLIGKWTVLFLTATGLLCAGLLVAVEPLLVTFFGSGYAGHQTVLMLMALAIVAEGFGMASANGLWALERPRVNFVAIVLGSITAISLSIALIPWLGLVGPALGSVIGRMVTSSAMVVAFLRLTRHPQDAEVST